MESNYLHYYLDENNVVCRAKTEEEVIRGSKQIGWTVSETMLKDKQVVSTSFVSLNNCFFSNNKRPPLVFETAVFTDSWTIENQYSTYKQAKRGHRRCVKRLKAKIKESQENQEN